jgi:hypothetical protein
MGNQDRDAGPWRIFVDPMIESLYHEDHALYHLGAQAISVKQTQTQMSHPL